jgi:hypothetical protein
MKMIIKVAQKKMEMIDKVIHNMCLKPKENAWVFDVYYNFL